MKSVICEDEDGNSWLVLPGDPAWPSVKLLASQMTHLVLPKMMMYTGQSRPEDRPGDSKLQNLASVYHETRSENVRFAFLRQVRLRECLDRLEDEYDQGKGQEED